MGLFRKWHNQTFWEHLAFNSLDGFIHLCNARIPLFRAQYAIHDKEYFYEIIEYLYKIKEYFDFSNELSHICI